MKKFACLLVLLSLLTACAAQEQEPALEPEPNPPAGEWKLLDENYMPIYEDPCDTIEFPDYDGMSREDFEAKALEQGYNSDIGPFAAWATSGIYSPSGRYLAYHSNKDCLNASSKDGFSVFLFDTETGEDRVLLSGSDGSYYIIYGWLDNETVLCQEANQEYGYMVCGVDGSIAKLDGVSEILHQNGDYIFENKGQNLKLLQIESDGGITEIAQTQVDGEQVMSCGISPDGKFVCFTVRPNWDSPDREIVLWNTVDGTKQMLTPPEMTQGENAAAISVKWQYNGFVIDFNIADTSDENGHNELWHYQNSNFNVICALEF